MQTQSDTSFERHVHATHDCTNTSASISLAPALLPLDSEVADLQPGMRLFRNNPDVVYTIMWGFLLANLVMGLIAAVLARIMAYLTLFPRGVIGPLILVFSVIGTYDLGGPNEVASDPDLAGEERHFTIVFVLP